jgi:membrane protein DedA with SNARE-associated domain
LQERNVDDENLQSDRPGHRGPQPPIREQVGKGASIVRSGVEDIEDLEQHQRRERHGLRVLQITAAVDEAARKRGVEHEFLWVLVNQAGVPLPVVPAILAAGAFARGAGELVAILTVVVGAALCADLVWYAVGRWRGRRALTWFGRFRWARRAMDGVANLSPVRRALVLAGARFLPEVNPVAAGLAGASRATVGRYLLYAIGSATVWGSTWIGMGYVVGGVIAQGDSSMMIWAAIVVAIGGMSVVLAGVLAVSRRETRQGEQLAAQAAALSRSAA